MHFLRTLFWIVVAALLVLFASNNWVPVTVILWDDLRLDAQLPVLVVGAFLLGLLPALTAYYATRWRYRRRMAAFQRPVLATEPTDDTPSLSMPPGAIPIAVPPGVA